MDYSRTDELAQSFNVFWQKLLGTEKDYYASMSLGDFVELKKAIGNINNIITLLVTNRFLQYLRDEHVIDQSQFQSMSDAMDKIHANTNGFDVEYNKGATKVVAEVKCNIPVGVDHFGAAQKNSIMKDIVHLVKGKTKSSLSESDIKDYFKFMVLLDYGQVTVSMKRIVKSMNDSFGLAGEEFRVKEYASGECLQKDIVYVVYIPLM